MTWKRVEIAEPILRMARRGGDSRVLWVDGELMLVRRVVSPTVVYVEPLSSLERWFLEREPVSIPFVALFSDA